MDTQTRADHPGLRMVPRRANAVYFAPNSWRVAARFLPMLKTHAAYLRARPGVRVIITGHTLGRGGARYNRLMSTRRAYAVALGLERLGVARERIDLQARGRPRDAGKLTHAQRAQRRRAELSYVSTNFDAVQIRAAQSESNAARRTRGNRPSLRIVARGEYS